MPAAFAARIAALVSERAPAPSAGVMPDTIRAAAPFSSAVQSSLPGSSCAIAERARS